MPDDDESRFNLEPASFSLLNLQKLPSGYYFSIDGLISF